MKLFRRKPLAEVGALSWVDRRAYREDEVEERMRRQLGDGRDPLAVAGGDARAVAARIVERVVADYEADRLAYGIPAGAKTRPVSVSVAKVRGRWRWAAGTIFGDVRPLTGESGVETEAWQDAVAAAMTMQGKPFTGSWGDERFFLGLAEGSASDVTDALRQEARATRKAKRLARGASGATDGRPVEYVVPAAFIEARALYERARRT